jgi:ankyrin repeat protein
LNARDADGNTVLLAAVRANAPLDAVRRLVEGGASVIASNPRRETPLAHATGPVLAYLIEKLKGWLSSLPPRLPPALL